MEKLSKNAGGNTVAEVLEPAPAAVHLSVGIGNVSRFSGSAWNMRPSGLKAIGELLGE